VFTGRLGLLTEHPLVGETRGIGLIGGVELVADKATRRPFDPKQGVGPGMAKFCEEEGLIARAMGDTVALCPPLIIDEAGVTAVFDSLEKALHKTEAWVAKENLRAAV
jgi:4-aminobutyrate--pyruvate transaminase